MNKKNPLNMLLAASSTGTDSGTARQCGELLWRQICSCLHAPERDEVKRILGAAAIDRNEDLHNELSALKRVLDDYRGELEAKRRTRVHARCAAADGGSRRVAGSLDDDGASGKALRSGSMKQNVGLRKLPSSLGRQYLEDQIRLFVSSLPSLQLGKRSNAACAGGGEGGGGGTAAARNKIGPSLQNRFGTGGERGDSLDGLRTPRERHLIHMIVDRDNSGAATSAHIIDDDEERRRTKQQAKHQNQLKQRQRRRERQHNPNEHGRVSPSRRPVTAPDLTSPEKDGATNQLSSSFRPSSRESEISTASAPDILQGFTPYLNVFDVDKVVTQLQAALHDEANTLLSQISSVQKTLETMYTTAHQEEEDDRAAFANGTAPAANSLSSPYSTADPTLEELRELSSWLEQRCRLEDIFKKASISSQRAKKKVLPLRNGGVAAIGNRPDDRDQRSSLTLPSFKPLHSASALRQQHQSKDMTTEVAPPAVVVKRSRKKNALRSRIREAQDAQYLM